MNAGIVYDESLETPQTRMQQVQLGLLDKPNDKKLRAEYKSLRQKIDGSNPDE